MADLLLDLVQILEDAGVVSGDGIDTFRDFRPETPDFVISLLEYPGYPTESGCIAVVRSIQISVRAPQDDPDSARLKAWEIFNVLDTPLERVFDTRETSAGTRWGVIAAKQSPFKMGIDDSNRFVYGFNIGVTTYRD